jgi:hypothetical protein
VGVVVVLDVNAYSRYSKKAEIVYHRAYCKIIIGRKKRLRYKVRDN